MKPNRYIGHTNEEIHAVEIKEAMQACDITRQVRFRHTVYSQSISERLRTLCKNFFDYSESTLSNPNASFDTHRTPEQHHCLSCSIQFHGPPKP
jgi:hypothetical protein